MDCSRDRNSLKPRQAWFFNVYKFGSKLPVADNTVILDLSGMNRIIEVNSEFGYATIEPGVTQKQLADYLKAQNISYFLDVTGSGCNTSIIGNTLERGVAYNSMRVESCLGMEIITGTEEILKTGFGHYENASTNHLYKYGVGPDFMGLFFQSNFGIVTQLTIKLYPIMPCRKIFIFSIKDEKNLGSFFETIKHLKSYNLFQSIIHVANKKRSSISIAPLIKNFCKDNNIQISDEELRELLSKQLKGAWSAVGSLMGTEKQIKVAQYEFKEHLSKYGKAKFFDLQKIDKLIKLLKFFHLKKPYFFLSATKPLLGLTVGKPTNAALHSLVWPNGETLLPTLNPDHSESGIIFCLPILPLNSVKIHSALEIFYRVTNQFSFEPAITLNTLNEFCIETVLSINFNRADHGETQKAHQCIKQLNQSLMEAGYYPYRIDIDNMDRLFQDNTHWKTLDKLKKLFDPQGIIAPGRYVKNTYLIN